jgi:hypothetical protein
VSWLDPFRDALDEAPAPVPFFLRDDDAGWGDERLRVLLDACADRHLPLDLAVIPAELERELATELVARAERRVAHVGMHQHGFAHVNHEPVGRKCEFGPARTYDAQLRDIESGRKRLERLLGPHVDPIFTPPWNRCTRVTAEVLADLGFDALSRESRAEPLGGPGLAELPVSVDWFAHRKGDRLAPRELAELAARAGTDASRPVGIMFHHAVMDDDEMRRAGELLDLIARHPNARVEPMRTLIAAPFERRRGSAGADARAGVGRRERAVAVEPREDEQAPAAV